MKELPELRGGLFVLKLGGRKAEVGEMKYRVKHREGCRVSYRGYMHIYNSVEGRIQEGILDIPSPPTPKPPPPHLTLGPNTNCLTPRHLRGARPLRNLVRDGGARGWLWGCISREGAADVKGE